MPLLWRFLLKSYFQVFFLCLTGFISVLLTARMQEIAKLAALNSEISSIFLFILYQIPYILPIAIPISGLISALLLLQRLSYTHELTAFRTLGLSVKTLSTPLLMAGLLLSFINLLISAELTPRCRLYSRALIQNTTTINPLFLMKKSKMIKLQDSYVDMKMTHLGKEVQDVIFAVKNSSNKRLSLLTAKKFTVEDSLMKGENVSIISNIAQDSPSQFDHLVIENQDLMSTSANALCTLMQNTTQKIGLEHLSFPFLLSICSDPMAEPKIVKEAQFEICKRLFFPGITFAFTFLGISLGMQIGRRQQKKGIYLAILLSTFTFICSIAAKSAYQVPHKMLFFYLLPFPIIFFTSFWFQKRIAGGIE